MVEIIMVIIILGLLTAIALPSMLSQGNKARVAAARSSAGAINRAQLAYRLNHKSFAPNIQQLGLGTDITVVPGYQSRLSLVRIPNETIDSAYAAVIFAPSRGMVGLSYVAGCVFMIEEAEESLILQGASIADVSCGGHKPGHTPPPPVNSQPSPQPVTPGNVLSPPSPSP